MASDITRKMLIQAVIGTGQWKKTVQEMRSTMDSLNAKALADATAQKKNIADQTTQLRQQILVQKQLQETAKTAQILDRSKLEAQKKQTEAVKTQIATTALATAELKKQQLAQLASIKLEQEQLKLSQQRLKIAQQQAREEERRTRGEGGGGILGGFGGLVSKLAGGGPLGLIMAGAAGGEVIAKGLEVVVEKLKEISKETFEATGNAALLQEQFEKLAKREGQDPEEFLNKLRVATRGLVEDNTQLIKVANQFMSGPLKLEPEQIVHLTDMTVALARATARGPNSVDMAMQALSRTALTGRAQMLAMAVGIDRAQLQMQGLGKGTSAVAREQMNLVMVMDAMARRLAEVGTPATTLEELFKQLHNVQSLFIEDMGVAITRSKSFSSMIQQLSSWLLKVTPTVLDVAKSIGDKLGGAFATLKPILIAVWDVFKSLGKVIVQLSTTLSPAALLISKAFAQAGVQISPFRVALLGLGSALEMVAYGAKEVSNAIDLMSHLMDAASSHSLDKAKAAFKEWNAIENKNAQELSDALAEQWNMAKVPVETGAAATGKAGPNLPTQEDLNVLREEAQLRLKIKTEEIKAETELEKQRIEIAKNDNQEMYNSGLESLENYLAKERSLLNQQHAVNLQQIENEKNAKLAELSVEAKGYSYKDETGKVNTVPAMGSNLYTLKKREIEKSAAQQTAAENLRATQAGFGPDKEQQADAIAAYRELSTGLTKIAKDGVNQRIQILEEEFKQGNVGADEYLTQKRLLIDKEHTLALQGFSQQYLASKKNAEDLQKMNVQVGEEYIRWQKQLTDVSLTEGQKRTQALDIQFQKQRRTFQANFQEQQRGPAGPSATQEYVIQQQLLQLTQQHVQDLIKLRDTNKDNKNLWLQISEEIAQSNAEIAQLVQRLSQLKTIGGATSGLFGGLSNILGAFPQSKGASAVADTFKTISESSAAIAPFQAQAAALQQQNPTGGSGGVQALKQMKGSVIDLFTDSKSPLATRLQSFTSAIGSAVGAVGGFIHSLTKSKTGGQGALSGGMAGLQMGSAFGPYGMIAGAAGGAILGGIIGAKEHQLQNDIHKIQDSMQSIVSSMNAGTISLTQAIVDMRQERLAAIQMLSRDPKAQKGGGKGGKKGFDPSQGQAVIDQIDAQIAQLVNQQQELLSQLDQQLAVLSQPTAFQQYAQSLDTIIQKYQQFSSAAQGNAQAVANAQLYLNESLQQYVQTLSVQLNEAQQQAIQDSLQLLNLEYQRQQIINQEAQQEYDILTKGVLTRQRTTAMTKGQEIGQLRYQRDMQLQQIDEQIALQQYKVQTEQKIFDLATTRIGLETQLLSLQEAQAGLQSTQVAALQQVVQMLQQGMASGSLMNQISGLMTGGNLPTGTGLLTTILGQLGLGGNIPPGILTGVGGATNYLAQIPQPYQSITNFINNLDPNFLQNLWTAMQTPPGSAQRASVLQEALPYKQDTSTSGFDFNSFASWIQSGAVIQGTTATVNTAPVPTGPGALPGGTGFPQPTAPGIAPSTIPSGPGTGGQTSFQSVASQLQGTSLSVGGLSTSATSAASALQLLATNANLVATGMQQGYNNAKNPLAPTPLTSYDDGGWITKTGPIMAHEGEYVLSTQDIKNNMKLVTEQHLTDLTQARANMEMTVVSARQQQTQLEMMHLQSLTDFWNTIRNNPIDILGSSSLEGQFQKVYEVRGRYGSGTFRRPVL